jgi:hypothetical protein
MAKSSESIRLRIAAFSPLFDSFQNMRRLSNAGFRHMQCSPAAFP